MCNQFRRSPGINLIRIAGATSVNTDRSFEPFIINSDTGQQIEASQYHFFIYGNKIQTPINFYKFFIVVREEIGLLKFFELNVSLRAPPVQIISRIVKTSFPFCFPGINPTTVKMQKFYPGGVFYYSI